MITFAALLIVVFILAKIGLWLIRSGVQEEAEGSEASKNRMIEYRAYLQGNRKAAFEKVCIEYKHVPMVLFNREDPSKIDGVICMKCTDTLPTPVTLSCDECWVVAVDGYLHIDTCKKHEKEPALL